MDAFSVTLSPNPADHHPIVAHEIFKFDVVTVNIRGGYNAQTGKFGLRCTRVQVGGSNKRFGCHGGQQENSTRGEYEESTAHR